MQAYTPPTYHLVDGDSWGSWTHDDTDQPCQGSKFTGSDLQWQLWEGILTFFFSNERVKLIHLLLCNSSGVTSCKSKGCSADLPSSHVSAHCDPTSCSFGPEARQYPGKFTHNFELVTNHTLSMLMLMKNPHIIGWTWTRLPHIFSRLRIIQSDEQHVCYRNKDHAGRDTRFPKSRAAEGRVSRATKWRVCIWWGANHPIWWANPLAWPKSLPNYVPGGNGWCVTMCRPCQAQFCAGNLLCNLCHCWE